MGQNKLDAFVPLDSPRLLATCQLLVDVENGVPSNVANNFTWAGVTATAVVIQLSPRSVRSPYVFDKIRSVSFAIQFAPGTVDPGDVSLWIPETNFLHRLKPDVTNIVAAADAITLAHTWPTVSGQLNVNAQPDSSLYVIKEWDSDVGIPMPYPHPPFCVGVINVQNWEVAPLLSGGG